MNLGSRKPASLTEGLNGEEDRDKGGIRRTGRLHSGVREMGAIDGATAQTGSCGDLPTNPTSNLNKEGDLFEKLNSLVSLENKGRSTG